MKISGGCYCGDIRYTAEGEPSMVAQCHCRECQYITGGGPNHFIAMPLDGFEYSQGTPDSFKRSDLENPVTREFCSNCGTASGTRAPGFPAMIIKVGTMDDPGMYEPGVAIFTCDKQSFHNVPEGLPAFEKMPG